MTDPWNQPATVRYYEAFCRRHCRYRLANARLAARAALAAGQRVLDLGAGLGGTAGAALPYLGPGGRVLCVEPARAMRARGAARLADARVHWRGEWPAPPERFDRILCGAALWQFPDLARAFRRLAALLPPGGALCFDLPAAYLGEPDPPGGGLDPWLAALPALLAGEVRPAPRPWTPLPDAAGLERLLRAAGLRPAAWRFRLRFTQRAYRDWLKIPPVGAWLGGDPRQRAGRLDAAFREVDPDSWRWEVWRGWSAWRT